MCAEIERRVEALMEAMRARRFRGEDPPVVIPAGATPEEVVACVLAAERLNAILELPGGTPFNPQESLAESHFRAAVRAMNAWSFREARRHLDDASRRARDPALQQRITLFVRLCALLQESVRLDPDRQVSPSHRDNLEQTLPRLDRLPQDERDHYRAEVERLAGLRTALKEDAYLRTVWLLVRARMALDASEDDFGLTWLLAAATCVRDRFQPGEYLAGLLERARKRILLLLGELPPEEIEAASQEVAGLRTWELFDALIAALDEATGREARRDMQQFGIRPFVESVA